MSDKHVSIIAQIIQNAKGTPIEIANLIIKALDEYKKQSIEQEIKIIEERDEGLNMNESCSGCYRPNFCCRCDTKN